MPAGWTRTSNFEGRSYTVQYQQPASPSDRAASVEANGRRITLIVTADPAGSTAPNLADYPGHPGSVAGVPATVVETAPPSGGRHGVAWRAGGLLFEVYAYMNEPELSALAATVTPTGQPARF